MELNEVNFTFNGQHCYRDYGCWFIWNDQTLTPKAKRDTYAISGRSGTVLLSGEPTYSEMKLKGKLGFRDAPRNETQARAMWRNVCAWLRGGRKRLELDCEPGRYYLAQVDDEIGWNNGSWDEGLLDVTFTLQPYSFASDPSSASAGFSEAGSLTFVIPTDASVPINLLVTNDGTLPLDAFTVAVGEDAVELAGIECLPGDTVEVLMDELIDVQKTHVADDVTSVTSLLPYSTRFDPLWGQGAVTLSITPMFAETGDGGHVTVLATARGVSV